LNEHLILSMRCWSSGAGKATTSTSCCTFLPSEPMSVRARTFAPIIPSIVSCPSSSLGTLRAIDVALRARVELSASAGNAAAAPAGASAALLEGGSAAAAEADAAWAFEAARETFVRMSDRNIRWVSAERAPAEIYPAVSHSPIALMTDFSWSGFDASGMAPVSVFTKSS
jgi:hypothetical protein